LTSGSHHPPDPFGAHAMLLAAAALLGLLAIALAIYGSYRFRWCAISGRPASTCLFGWAFILVCIGIQIGWSGLTALFVGLQHPAGLS
jgi:small neutral amino acid transporter SnatA (MarC family)